MDTTLFRLPLLALSFSATNSGRHFACFLVAIKMPGICINCALMNGIMPFGMISKLISSISRYLILFDITATFLLDSRKEIQTRSLASDPRFQDSARF